MRVKNTLSRQVYTFIKNNYSLQTPVLIQDIYTFFSDVNPSTIRTIFKRLVDNELLVKIRSGVYAVPNKDSLMGESTVYISDVIKRKYLGEDRIIGYRSGLNFANYLGLTKQTASVDFIISNKVSNKKREVTLNKNRLILNGPKVKVTSYNYKLLQIMDLLNNFEKLSEIDLKASKEIILDYLSTTNLKEEEIEEIVSRYPLKAQVKFYKIGGHHATS